ncbi:hydroxysqualene dehydroxylase [Bacillus fonticola]|uniref:hydroxysqualene dehydroxylase n=1 Tax=Bacillus fonticola TaxID=2728853 RepID=UPI0014732358|nr:NAD(P)/FAD-dependent oxidoreductase [Bacillus fonticola]
MDTHIYDAIVVGGGLAGLTSGLLLAEKNQKVLVLEAEDQVGGRTSSWNDHGMHVESGFHRYIGYYSQLPKILRKADVELNEMLTWEEKIHVRVGQERPVVMGLAPLFGFVKMIKGLIGNHKYLSLKDKLSLIPFFVGGLLQYLFHPKKLDQIDVRSFAKKCGVTDRAFRYLIIPLSTGIYFLPPTEYSAYVFFGLFAPGVMKFYKLRLGAFNGGMTEVMCEPIARKIRELGGEVKTGVRVHQLQVQDGKVTGVETEAGDRYSCEKAAILATTLHNVKDLALPFKDEPFFANTIYKLPMMPASVIQIELDKPAIEIDITSFAPLTHLASFAEQSRTTFQESEGRLSIILTPPEKFLELDGKETLEIVLKDLDRVGIPIRDHVLDYRKIDHVDDFHSLRPGNQHLRPQQKTPIKSLYLAGDYTHQPYFATMEGAAASGIRAVDAYFKDHH